LLTAYFDAQTWSTLEIVSERLLISLWDLLTPGVDSQRLLRKESRLCEAESGEAWVYRVPDDFMDAVIACDPKRICELAPMWANTEKFGVFPVSEAQRAIQELADFVQRARAEGKSVLLYIAT
jgi:hypothetical protein